MDKKLIEWNPLNSSQYCIFSNGNLDLHEITYECGRSSRKVSCNIAPQLTCMEWNYVEKEISTRSPLIAYGNMSGSVAVYDWSAKKETKVNPGKIGGRTCNSVAWSKSSPNRLAAGFDLLRNEYSAAIWDIERLNNSNELTQTTSHDHVLHNFALGEAISSLAWLPREDNIIVMGTSRGWVRIYDLRTKKSLDLSIPISAGERVCKVKGLRVDPGQSSIIAGFSDLPGDPVRIFDLRLGDTSGQKSRLNILTSILPYSKYPDEENLSTNPSTIVDVAWSPLRANTIAIASSNKCYIPVYNILKSSGESELRTPLHSLSIPEPVRSMSWTHPRLLLGLSTGVLDISVHERLALSYSPIAALNDNIPSLGFLTPKLLGQHMEEVNNVQTSSLSEIDISENSKNFSVIIRKRALAGYSFQAAKNLQVLSDELDAIYNFPWSEQSSTSQSLRARFERRQFSLEHYKLWEWINRVHSENEIEEDSGILRIFRNQSLSNDTKCRHEKFGVFAYISEARSKVLEMCGWLNAMTYQKESQIESKKLDMKNDNEHITKLKELLSDAREDSFERAAALAVWHGNFEYAVDTLQSYPAQFTSKDLDIDAEQPSNISDAGSDDWELSYHGWDEKITLDYLHTISLVAMCFAGYHCKPETPEKQNSSVWVSMCKQLISILETYPRAAKQYLIATCNFLLASLDDNPDYSLVLNNEDIYLEDRIAFACNFEGFDKMNSWIKGIVDSCKQSGRLNGLLITGLSLDGLSIIQRFIDNTSDVQTSALVTARLMCTLPKVDDIKDDPLIYLLDREKQWLSEYRSLLNKWQMFVQRSKLDVEIGKIQRKRDQEYKVTFIDSIIVSKTSDGVRQGNRQSSSKSSDRSKAMNVRQMYAQPAHLNNPHLLIRCHYCGTPLPFDITNTQVSMSQFTRKLRPVINCCVNCKKQLPRCYVCQLYLGMVNPNAELNRMLHQKRQFNDSHLSQSEKSSTELEHTEQHVLEFGQWFFFCQRCKHGGHAVCIDEWFCLPSFGDRPLNIDTPRSCGVNGCFCLCSKYG